VPLDPALPLPADLLGAGAGSGDPVGAAAPPGRLAGAGAGAIPIGVGVLTVTVVCPLMLPMVALICALPGATPRNVPDVSTAAMLVAPLVHITWLVRSAVL
jgi:hypothetical protein